MRCAACPVASGMCVGEDAAWICRGVSAGDAGWVRTAAEQSAIERPTAPVVPREPAEPPSPPSVAAHRLAQSCDYRGPVCGRGCSGDHRICGAGRGAVTHAACLLCVADPLSPGGSPLD